jgi:TonB-dependent starch-binding outer membrane protein SusC
MNMSLKFRFAGNTRRGSATHRWSLAWPALLVLAVALPAQAQQSTYRLTGQVVDATTLRPLASVAVVVQGTQQGTLTGVQGTYELTARLTPGTYVIEYSLIGRETVRREVELGGGLSVDVPQVALRESAVQLEGIVVTGTGVATQRRALGNAVSVVGGESVANANVGTVDAALQGKVAGAQIMSNTGTPGGGVSVRLRGTSSIVGGAEPLYIVDGVIVDNSSDQQVNFGYRSNPSNRLADLNPNDIERVEVLKGAAAAALYGSRANNGVIQIFTRRGAAGATRFNVSTRATLGMLPKEIDFALAPVDAAGAAVQRFDHQDLIFRDSWGNETALSVSGGGDQTRFYMSGSYTKDNGIMIGSSNERISARMNVDQSVGSWLTLAGGANYIRNSSDLLINGENGTGGILTAIVFTPTIVDLAAKDPETGQYVTRVSTFPNPLEVIDNWKAPQSVNRFVGSFQARATPEGWWPSVEYRLGYDTYTMETGLFVPRGTPGAFLTGSSTAITRTQYLVNNDIVASRTFSAGSGIDLTSTVGMNHTYSREQTLTSSATDLVPATELVRGAVQLTSQNRFETATIGVFGQQQIGFDNRLFLTGALRWDASSTFGSDERWQLYPKLSGSYVLSESGWWQDSGIGGLFGEFRLRGALGYAGNQPPVGSAYARFPRYAQEVNINRSGLVHLSNPGNPNLKPERQREYEIGFDAGILDERVGVSFTYYNQYVKDLLLTRPFPPSTGYGSVLDNVGELSNRGVELQIDSRNIDRPNLGWNTSFTFSRNRNRVEKLAGASFNEGYFNRVEEGSALGIWQLRDYERDASGNIVLDAAGLPVIPTTRATVGDPNPDFQASLRNELRIGENLTATVLLDGVFGHDVWNQTRRIMDRFEVGPLYDKQLRGETVDINGEPVVVTNAMRLRLFGAEADYLEDGTFVKLREISFVYTVPSAFASRFGAASLALEVAGRNLLTFTDYTGYDPETNMFGTSTVARGTDFANYPNPRQFSFGVRAGF